MHATETEKQNVPELTGEALFHHSMQQLNDGLGSGSILTQYERLYRKNPELAISDAKNSDNLMKNRYRDISPCKIIQNLHVFILFQLKSLIFYIF